MEKILHLKRTNRTKFLEWAQQTIEAMTEVTRDHLLTPELSLRLVTPRCSLWLGDHRTCPFPDPYWAFYWPGGEALTRYVLNNKRITERKHVLDIGSGCGSVAISVAKLGLAATVTANDIDPIAAVAIKLNASLNGCQPNSIRITTDNMIGNLGFPTKFNCILLGDMFYNEEFGNGLIRWLLNFLKHNEDVDIFIGDPGRHEKFYEEYKQFVEKVAEYEVGKDYAKFNDLKACFITIWKMSCRL